MSGAVNHSDVAIVGAGILGLAHAVEALSRGLTVRVFERDTRIRGASVRNFGLIFPSSLASGEQREWALHSRGRWLSLAQKADFWCNEGGMLFLTHEKIEEAVAEEYRDAYRGSGIAYEMIPSRTVHREFGHVLGRVTFASLYSPLEIRVNPRRALPAVASWVNEHFDGEVLFEHTVQSIWGEHIKTSQGSFTAERIVVTPGVDASDLFPDTLDSVKHHVCRLQMMRSKRLPGRRILDPAVVTGLSFVRYPAFDVCQSLPQLRSHFERSYGRFLELGIHLLVAQDDTGRLILGDSHENQADAGFEYRSRIEDMILDIYGQRINPTAPEIRDRWIGHYLVTDLSTPVIHAPQANTRVVTGVGGLGMTLSFGLASYVLDNWTSELPEHLS